MTRVASALRRSAVVIFLAALAACQTVPHKVGFSAAQVAALENAGFKPVGENYELSINNRVLFGFDSAELQPESIESIGQLSQVLLGVGIHGATVEGHTDSSGTDAYNQKLSEQRASVVRALLVQRGMSEQQIRSFGLGETDPVAPNDTEENRSQNRRVVIVITPTDAAPL